MIPHADKMIERARKGERLNSKDRQHCVGYLMGFQPDMTNTDMARLFHVSEGQIRQDKKKIREDKAKHIKEDDIGLVIADVALAFEQQVRDIEASKKRCKMGSRIFLDHCVQIFRLNMQKIEALQNLGYYPKNLGNMSVERFEYVAIVDKQTGAVNTRSVGLVMDVEVDAPDHNLDAIEAEFNETKALPPGSA